MSPMFMLRVAINIVYRDGRCTGTTIGWRTQRNGVHMGRARDQGVVHQPGWREIVFWSTSAGLY